MGDQLRWHLRTVTLLFHRIDVVGHPCVPFLGVQVCVAVVGGFRAAERHGRRVARFVAAGTDDGLVGESIRGGSPVGIKGVVVLQVDHDGGRVVCGRREVRVHLMGGELEQTPGGGVDNMMVSGGKRITGDICHDLRRGRVPDQHLGLSLDIYFSEIRKRLLDLWPVGRVHVDGDVSLEGIEPGGPHVETVLVRIARCGEYG